VAVRVKVRVRSLTTGRSKVLVVLANGGAESERPTVVVDEKIAGELGLYPPPEQSELYEAIEASTIRHVYVVPQSIELELLDEETEEVLSKVVADLAIEEGVTEPFITDVAIDALGIHVISFSKGLWRHANDVEGRVRKSAVV